MYFFLLKAFDLPAMHITKGLNLMILTDCQMMLEILFCGSSVLFTICYFMYFPLLLLLNCFGLFLLELRVYRKQLLYL